MLDKRNIKNIYELTPMQEGMLFHALYDAQSSAYFEQTRDRIEGHIDINIYEQAWQMLVQRHDILQTLFVNKTDKPLQIVLKQRPIPFKYMDLRAQTSTQQQQYSDTYASEDKAQKFNLSADPLMRIAVLHLHDTQYEVIWSLHHILLDAWSLNILQNELFSLYTALQRHQTPLLAATTPFSYYIRWLKQQDKTITRTYWQDYLQGYTHCASLPQRTQTEHKLVAKKHVFQLSNTLSDAIRQCATQQKVTLGIALQAAWGILLSQFSQQHDVVFALTVSGRPTDIDGIENTVGLFINAVPVRVNTQGHSWHGLLELMQTADVESKAHHYYSLADIQANTVLKKDLFNHILVLETAPDDEVQQDDVGFRIIASEHFDHTNYDLTVQIAPTDCIQFTLLYNVNTYEQSLIHSLEAYISQFFEILLSQSDEALETLALLKQEDINRFVPQTAEVITTATFTAEPLNAAFNYYASLFNLNVRNSYADYNQVFQQLLEPNNRLHQNTGISCILVRFEDWIRDSQYATAAEYCHHLEQNFTDLQSAFCQHSHQGIWLLGIFPPAPHLDLATEIFTYINALNQRWKTWLSTQVDVQIFDAQVLARQYAISNMFDAHSDQIGHMPFNVDYYAALGSHLARQCVALYQPPFKVLALDCDNTLWQGICGEVGASNVVISQPYQALQQQLLAKRQQGFLLVLCSKNNEADVWDVFTQHPDMLLQREHIVASRINWQLKSENLCSLAQELNVGLDSFIFLDDSGMECEEVMQACPQVFSLQVPHNVEVIPTWLQHIWALDRLQITAEDQQRSALYKVEKQRREQQQSAPSVDDFLKNLQVHVNMSTCQDFQIKRLAQLSQRTNQFNLNTVRLSEQAIRATLQIEQQHCWGIQVEDKFGQYGLVGLLRVEQHASHLLIQNFFLSCRVLGRGVEHAIMYGLQRYAVSIGISHIIADYTATEKNQPLLNFLRDTKWQQTTIAHKSQFCIDVEHLPQQLNAVTWTDIPPQAPEPISINKAPSAISTSTAKATSALKQQQYDWQVALHNQDNLQHLAYYQVLQQPQAQQIAQLAQPFETHNSLVRARYVAAQNPMQTHLIQLWESVLGQEKIGIHDNFFNLGGHSLLAVRLISQLEQAFKLPLAIHLLFQYPTVQQFAEYLVQQSDTNTDEHCIPMLPTQQNGKPLFLLPGYAGSIVYLYPLAQSLGEQYAIYALQTPGINTSDASELPTTVEALARHHVDNILKQQAQGSYHLIGHSMGGIIAFEIARQLEARGEKVALLALLDSHAPEVFAQDLQHKSIDTQYLLAEIVQEFAEQAELTIALTWNDNASDEQNCHTALALLQQHDLYQGDIDDLKQLLIIRQRTFLWYLQYKHVGKVHCPIHLFYATAVPTDNDLFLDAWQEYSHTHIKKIAVSGNHFTMLDSPQVQSLAKRIQTIKT